METPEALVAEQLPYVFVEPVSVALNVGTVPTTALLAESFKVTVTVEVVVPSATTGPVPLIVEFATEGPAGLKITVPSALMTGVTMERVFVSAVKDRRVHVDKPEALEAEQVP